MTTCNVCGETKSDDDFYRNRKSSNGRQPLCKKCADDRTREYRESRKNDPEYRLRKLFTGIKQRCNNPKNSRYAYYGGRGITCEFPDVDAFIEWSLANGYRVGLEIDREDNDGPYSPDNCRWVTRSVNVSNREVSRHIEAFGETKTMQQWVDDARCSVPYNTLLSRLDWFGWDAETAITKPADRNLIEAFGETKTLSGWSRDPRCVVSYSGLRHRLDKLGMEPEEAITKPNRR